jgi:hypothetical protein
VIDAHGVQRLLHLPLIQLQDVPQRVLVLAAVHGHQDFLHRIHQGLRSVLHHLGVIYRPLHAYLILVLVVGMLGDDSVD